MGKLKRGLSALMAVAMLFSLLYLPANADEYRTEQIQLSLQFLNEQQEPMESGVSAGNQFVVALHFSGNPTNTETTPNGITSVALYIQYDSAVAAPKADGYIKKGSLISGSGYNPTISDNTAFIGWMSNDGILDKEDEQCESGVMSNFYYIAAQDASLEQLAKAIKIVRTAIVQENGSPVERSSKLTDFNRKEFPLDLGDSDGTHNITVTPAEHGTVTPDKTTAKESDTVTLTVAPETGYRLKEGTLKATDAAGDIALTAAGNNAYTFTMRTSDVNVVAEFEQIPPEPQPHNVNIPANIPNGKVTSSPNNPVAENATVTLTVAPETGYRLKEGTLKATDAAGEIALTAAGNNAYTFTMRTSDVNVTADFEPIPPGPGEDINIKTVAVPTEGGTVTPNKTAAKEGDVIQLTVTPNTNGGYVLDTLTVTDNEGAIQYTRTNAYTTGNSTYTFTVRKSDVTVTANFVRPDGPPYSVTILPSEHGTVKAEDAQGNGVEKANPGDEVILRVTPDQDPVIGMYVLDTLTVKDSKNNVIPSPLKSGMDTTYQFSLHSFSMPDGPVTVEATFVGQPRVIVPESVERGRVTSDKRTAGAGETVTPNENCQLEELKVTDADGDIALTKVNETTYTFSMGATDATVSVRFVQTREVTVTYAPGKGSGDATTKTERLPLAAPGNPGFTPPSGKQFNGWTLPNSDTFYRVGAEITDLDDGATLTAHYTEGCYVATAVYGSYDCPEVWTLRRFRDNVLAKTWYGRLFIKLYYAISPTAVKLFGDMDWFQNFWRGKLDDMVSNLQADGFESTPYQDKDW